jgi:anti-sigma-K factor RskA
MTPPAGKQYQLWAIVDGKPVDAGMIDLNQPIVFQQMKTINSAQAFAVTIENVGGSATPSLETMCLLGNV